MSIRWLPQAQRNRLEQLDYIAQDKPLAAIGQDEQIERQINMLLAHPKMGRPGRVTGSSGGKNSMNIPRTGDICMDGACL